MSLVAQSVGTAAVAYPVASNLQGTAVPTVVATCQDSNYYCAVTAITTTGFSLQACRRDGTNVTASPVCNWVMVG